MSTTTRRRYLQLIGTTVGGSLTGCAGNGGGSETVAGEEYPAIDTWLTETDIGGADETYEGVLVDRRNRDRLTIEVGAEGNGGDFAYAPSAVLVSSGTSIDWEWTGRGNPHNVEAEPEDQIGESDYEFSSGDAVGGSGVKYSLSMDMAGIALYHCEPHLGLGMKGGVAVE